MESTDPMVPPMPPIPMGVEQESTETPAAETPAAEAAEAPKKKRRGGGGRQKSNPFPTWAPVKCRTSGAQPYTRTTIVVDQARGVIKFTGTDEKGDYVCHIRADEITTGDVIVEVPAETPADSE